MTDPRLMQIPEVREEAERRVRALFEVRCAPEAWRVMDPGWKATRIHDHMAILCNLHDPDSFGWWLRWLRAVQDGHGMVLGNAGPLSTASIARWLDGVISDGDVSRLTTAILTAQEARNG